MADKKPTYDELLKNTRDHELSQMIVNTVICCAGGTVYLFLLSLLTDIAITGLLVYNPVDNLPPFLLSISYIFLLTYGLWHIFTRLTDIWYGELDRFFEGVTLGIDKFFRAQAKAFASLDKEDEPKVVQTKLVEK